MISNPPVYWILKKTSDFPVYQSPVDWLPESNFLSKLSYLLSQKWHKIHGFPIFEKSRSDPRKKMCFFLIETYHKLTIFEVNWKKRQQGQCRSNQSWFPPDLTEFDFLCIWFTKSSPTLNNLLKVTVCTLHLPCCAY